MFVYFFGLRCYNKLKENVLEVFILLKDILTPSKRLFVSDAHTELRGQYSRSRGVSLIAGNLVGNRRIDRSGISARVFKNGTYGFSSMAEYSSDAAKS